MIMWRIIVLGVSDVDIFVVVVAVAVVAGGQIQCMGSNTCEVEMTFVPWLFL